MSELTAPHALHVIQTKLKVPKGQRNDFGKYNYRSLEDICAAVKPLLKETETSLLFTDRMIQVGDRIYVEAKATLYDKAGGEVSATSIAREPDNKKGMDASQVSGAASSYARKYAASGLFSIDNGTVDADAMPPEQETKKPTPCTQEEIDEIEQALMETNSDFDAFCKYIGIKMLAHLDSSNIGRARQVIEQKRQKNAGK